MGVTKQGLIAVLTNFREDTTPATNARSRGAMVNAFLTQPADQGTSTTAEFVRQLVEDDEGLKGVGGFSLVCGRVGEGLAVVSNRTSRVEGTKWILGQSGEGGETVGFSNAAFGDRSWAKVTRGEEMLRAVVGNDAREEERSRGGFLEKLFGILSDDTLPRRNLAEEGGGLAGYLMELRNSIFIPVIGGEVTHGASADELAAARSEETLQGGEPGSGETSMLYGTQKQSVVLVSHQGHVTFVERTLYDGDGRPVDEANRDGRFEFDVEDWKP